MQNKSYLVMDVEKRNEKPNTVLNKKGVCPFCESQVPQLIQEGLMIEEKDTMYWAKNKFPMLKDTYQTLIVETMKCNEDLTTYSEEYAKKLFSFIFESREKLLNTGAFKEVLYLKNHGLFSGSSIAHSHSQLIGLKEQTYDYKGIEESIKGAIVFENKHVYVSVSEMPRSEFYEYNVVWEKGDDTQEYVEWIQTLIRFIIQESKFDSYNLLFHETPETNIMKVIPKRTNSIFYIGYGIRQVPNDIAYVAKDILRFSKKKLLNSDLVVV